MAGQNVDNSKIKFWKNHIEKCHYQGLSRRAYAGENGIRIYTFDYWVRRIRKLESTKELVLVNPKSYPDSTQIEPLEVIVRDRYRIKVSSGFDREVFSDVIQSLERLG